MLLFLKLTSEQEERISTRNKLDNVGNVTKLEYPVNTIYDCTS